MAHSKLRSLPAFLTLAILVTGAATLPRAADAETVDIDCFAAADDADGDGYARKDAPRVVKTVDEDKKLYCPAGYVRKAGDCDDTRMYVHPNAPEFAFNLMNEDCDTLTDEPELVYFPNGNQNTSTSFSIRVKIASSFLLSQGSALAYEVEYADLAATALPTRTAKRMVGTLPSDYAFDAPVTGLAPARVYQARLHFYKATAGKALVGGRLVKTTTWTELGVQSELYYSATKGDGQLEDARLDLLLDGFYQLSESNRGRIGYRGTVKRDGTRFGAATGERWCSEFYTWLASAQFYQIGIYNTVGGVMWWFMTESQYHSGSAKVRTVAERADYIPVDTDGDGEANHSTLFVAYDVTLDKVWTLEGNDGNYVRLNPRSIGSSLLGVGHLTPRALTLAHLLSGDL